MPEMPGVMTDILISMDDRLRLIRIGKKSGLGLAKKLVVTCMNWLKLANISWNLSVLVGIGRIFVGSWFPNDQRLQVPLLLQLAARRCEAVRHHWHQVLHTSFSPNQPNKIRLSKVSHPILHQCSGTPSWPDRYSLGVWSKLEVRSRSLRIRRCQSSLRWLLSRMIKLSQTHIGEHFKEQSKIWTQCKIV